MVKTKTLFSCQKCAAQLSKWAGQCNDCGGWNCIVEEAVVEARPSRAGGFTGMVMPEVQGFGDVDLKDTPRVLTGFTELDRVLGGGLVLGSVVLIGGDPGIGKSTLLLQSLAYLSEAQNTLYVTGEESLQQVTLSAKRLGLGDCTMQLLADTQVERIIQSAKKVKPEIIVIDSIQTLFSESVSSAPGSVSQVRESAARLVAFAKQCNIAVFIVGHVTKEGSIAGPRVLEHMVDAVLYFEGQRDNRFRVVRAVKNRFGAVNELAVLAMTDKGLRQIDNPSKIFLSRYSEPVSGSVAMVTWEGSRPLLVEIQALVDESHLGNPRRVCVGLEQNRLAMLLAALHRHGGVGCFDQDVFVNVVGGMRVTETGIDLAILLAILSSLRDKPLPMDLIVFGEVGLAGEIRPVQSGQERLKEAAKHGFKHAIVPFANAPKQVIPGMKVSAVKTLAGALAEI